MSHRQRPKRAAARQYVRCARCRRFVPLARAAQYEWGFLCARDRCRERAMDAAPTLDARKGAAA